MLGSWAIRGEDSMTHILAMSLSFLRIRSGKSCVDVPGELYGSYDTDLYESHWTSKHGFLYKLRKEDLLWVQEDGERFLKKDAWTADGNYELWSLTKLLKCGAESANVATETYSLQAILEDMIKG